MSRPSAIKISPFETLPYVIDSLHLLISHVGKDTGSGVRIGIIDTGVDYLHPALGGCFGKDCLVQYGYDLVGDSWTGYDNPEPDDDPYDDCEGHGTHVSGIIAAQPNKMGFTGVAPGATLGMYKVFSCYSFGTTDDVLIAALLVQPSNPCLSLFAIKLAKSILNVDQIFVGAQRFLVSHRTPRSFPSWRAVSNPRLI